MATIGETHDYPYRPWRPLWTLLGPPCFLAQIFLFSLVYWCSVLYSLFGGTTADSWFQSVWFSALSSAPTCSCCLVLTPQHHTAFWPAQSWACLYLQSQDHSLGASLQWGRLRKGTGVCFTTESPKCYSTFSLWMDWNKRFLMKFEAFPDFFDDICICL